ncbi:hypothetical protein EYR38_004876 [Pleurotus pulmonarius]|nr:hypothetical protein EYR38_004876 [Pleurotus pulmonarius]
MPRRNSSTTTKAPRKRPWATRAQKDYLRSMTQAFHDTMDDKFGRKRFWADVREEWLSRWDLTDRQNRRLSTYFRDAMRSRGAIPPRVRKPKKANKAARPPLAATTRHQARQAEEPESTQDSSEAVEEAVPRAPHTDPPTPPSVPSSPAPGAVTVLPPPSIWTTEVSKCLAFELGLPGIEHPHDVELVIQGQLLAVYARSDTVAYKWSTNVGGPVKANHVYCGLEDEVLRVRIKVMCLENITDERQVFIVNDMLPW